MFFSIIILEILLNQRINAFIFAFVEKRVEINVNVFVVSFCDNKTSSDEML